MLIICENFDGASPARAVPYGLARASYKPHIGYVRWKGSKYLPAGVYVQRYDTMYELGHRQPFYAPRRIELDDLVQETASVDHPGNQS